MSLQEISLELIERDPPQNIQRIIDASDDRIDALFSTGENKRVPKFIPSDPLLLYNALEYLTIQELPMGRVFCEWGCGFGTGVCLAAALGYSAYGLENDATLVSAAREMAAELDLAVDILETSYFPEGFESYSGIGGEYLIRDNQLLSADGDLDSEATYDGMEHEIAEIDVFFAYPWPMEQELMQELFDAVAVEGAILISYHKAGEICAFRKVSDESDDFDDL
ncbi:MAG: hypothetical protein ACI9R3_002891 [Verrucomicrobiales bacterium]|jgi:hypothetical protein